MMTVKNSRAWKASVAGAVMPAQLPVAVVSALLALGAPPAFAASGVAAGVAGNAAAVQAGSAGVRVFSIAAGPLEQVLNDFGTQAGWLLTYAPELVEHKQSPGLEGNYLPQAALALLLENTGLQAVETGSGGYMLQRTPARAHGAGPALLDVVTVTGVDGSYGKPGAHSSRVMNENMQSLDAVLRSMPGTYTQLDPLQGAVTVNVRGMSGLGRVNTMVDGVTQTYYGVAPSSYHGAGANTSSGVMIDPNFLVGVDVSRGSSAGSQGVNALAGSANMRTIGVDDVLREGRSFGMLGRASVGSNGLGRTGMVTLAGRTQAFTDSGSIAALVGMSASTLHATYTNGGGRSSEDFLGEDNEFLKQSPRSQLYKVELRPNRFHRLEFSGRNYKTQMTKRDIRSDDYYLKYNYAPGSDLVDVNMLLSTSRSQQDFEPGAPFTYESAAIKNRSQTVDLSNTSRFALGETRLALLVGGKFMNTRYQRDYSRVWEDEGYNAFLPEGRQRIAALYTGLGIIRGIYQLDLNLNYTRSKVQGFKPECPEDVACFPQGASELNLKDSSFNPSVTFSAQVTPWLQPFVGYSHSTRAPNVQEVFFGNEGGGSMNPFLKPEHARTVEAGFNLIKPDLLTAGDSFRLKALAYRTRIRDYIASESFFLCNDGSRCKDIDNSSASFNAHMSVNTLSPVTTRGYELEAAYDAGVGFVNVAWSWQHTNQPTSIASTTQLGFGYDDMADLPRSYGTIDLGGRFFDRRLVIGSLIKYTGRVKRLSTEGISLDSNTVEKEDMPRIPTIVDLYGSYKVSEALSLRFSVQNLADKDYAEALNRMNQDLYYAEEGMSINTTARGRTYMIGAELRF
ncbi:TonB-dependent receptor domain-containing protein [Kerstersia gyiorum]|uniref:TonB-dependent receptor domain-containing protein n=1 Tax=Kerstersia gyiorum TaxID=206506 RepID=UPI00209C73EE|nr:TonB-dependent receptor [Kerstersia gyiorum]MCP1632549.1 hemoglobin/transferrin/lactoferrin receptor protein [Kerstersia gyiorum]MCP1634945.1 hemoglobin/transferrin/lactoferrin receptor protein [Kerstersia gyiorum]MCP1670127.1 hemoglobin/transferrin/lactoferrin receptor protein [Kerstersia gyiorum]MCP1678268.1 hemoglobin/transferrin/lactoferrin receptor protein [Kerstersia gyiorum]MCP1680729.1 hemoglobin/transferrin/lactoferrin receptor protein [Kerstersia gyiorum]